MWGRGFCSYKEFSQQFTNKLLSVLKYWEGGGFICCLACFHDKKLMCSDICFLRLPAFKEFFDLDKAVRGEEPYLFCSYSTLDGIGNKCSVLQLRFPSLLFCHWRELRLQWVTLSEHLQSWCKFFDIIFSRAKEGLYMLGVCFFTFVCVILLQPLHMQLCPLRYCQAGAWAKHCLCVCQWEEKFQYSEFRVS